MTVTEGIRDRVIIVCILSIEKTTMTYSFHESPLHDIKFPIIAIAVYLTTVFFLIRLMDYRKRANKGVSNPLITSPLILVIHNLFLSVGSLIMFIGCITEVYTRYQREGSSFWLFCEREGADVKGNLYYWSYLYYLSKYYELLDTIIGLLRGSRMPNFKIQVYHHVVVIFMAWAWCQTGQSLQFIGLLFNTFVHVVMYMYYAASAGRWLEILEITTWKKTIKMTTTRLQIIQFMTSFVCIVYSMFIEMNRSETEAHCSGFGADSFYALYANSLFNATLLLAFLNVFKVNAKKKNTE